MMPDKFERALGERFAGWNFVPRRRARGMRQRNQVEAVARTHDAKFGPNYPFQFCAVDELHDRQSADRNNETRPQNPYLIVYP